MYEVVHRQRKTYTKVNGKLYDTIRFNSLPGDLRTEDVEETFGEIMANEAGQGVVVCGSLGEVANKPELGNVFEIVKKRSFDWRFDTNTLQNHQKSTVWSYLVRNQAYFWGLTVLSQTKSTQLKNTVYCFFSLSYLTGPYC